MFIFPLKNLARNGLVSVPYMRVIILVSSKSDDHITFPFSYKGKIHTHKHTHTHLSRLFSRNSPSTQLTDFQSFIFELHCFLNVKPNVVFGAQRGSIYGLGHALWKYKVFTFSSLLDIIKSSFWSQVVFRMSLCKLEIMLSTANCHVRMIHVN